ncbi:MAG: carbohydrate ABC transporter permease [Crenarchaeota archaeon]|nr:carbohydrate ABC transporter permease [Thermoproteota archaeon]
MLSKRFFKHHSSEYPGFRHLREGGIISKMRHAFREDIIKCLIYMLMIAIILLYLYPIWVILIIALGADVYQAMPPEIIPLRPHLKGFEYVFSNPSFLQWIQNSLLFTLAVTGASILISIPAGYALSRVRFPGRSILFWLTVLGMMLPLVMLYVPLYIQLTRMKLINTYIGLIVPVIPSAYNVFLMKQAFDSVPEELQDAATIDGAGPFTIAFRIFLPIIRPIVVTAMLFNIVWNWNNFAWPLFAAPQREYWTLPLGVFLSTWSYTIDFWKLAAGGTILFLPPLILYIIATSYFLRGIEFAGLKR